MKGLGIVLLVFAGIDFIVAIAASSSGNADASGTYFAGAFMIGALGGFLVYRANKKKEEAENKEKWENENK